jgi:hypothetical protein
MGSAPRYLSIRPGFTVLPPAPGQSHPFDHAPVASGLPRKEVQSQPAFAKVPMPEVDL